MNVVRVAQSATTATWLGKSPASGALSLFLSDIGRHEPASMQATPSRRIPAPRPALRKRFGDLQPDQWHRCKPFTFLKTTCITSGEKLLGNLRPRGEGKRTAQIRYPFPLLSKNERYERFIFIPLSNSRAGNTALITTRGAGTMAISSRITLLGALALWAFQAQAVDVTVASNLCGTGESRAGGQHLCESERREVDWRKFDSGASVCVR